MKASFSLVIFIPLRSLLYHAKSWSYTSHFLEHQTNAREVACEASVSVLFRSKGRAKNGASKRGGGGEERRKRLQTNPRIFVCKRFLPSPSPPSSFIFCLSFHFSRGQNQESCSSAFLGSETARKRLLRRLTTAQGLHHQTI